MNNNDSATRAQITAAQNVVLAVAECIRELGEVPSGHLYARLMGKLSLESYQSILGVLKRAGLIEEQDSHLLKWVGPKVENKC